MSQLLHYVLTFAFATSIIGIISQTMQVVGSRYSNIPGILYMILFVITACIAHLWFNAIERSCISILYLLSFSLWHNEAWRYRFKIWHTIVYFALFAVLYFKLSAHDASPMLDASTATLGLAGTLLCSMRNKWGFLLFFICNGLETIMFFKLGDKMISLGVMELLFTLSNPVAYYIWTKNKVHR